MRRFVALFSLVALAACGDTTAPKTAKKPPAVDPYITIRVRNNLDTTTAPGQTSWRVYALLSGPDVTQNGVAFQGTYTLTDARIGSSVRCMAVGADSIGQRFIAPLAIGDTVGKALLQPIAYDTIVTRWYNGNHAALPSGFMLLTIDPTDAWDSQQFIEGHGLVRADPIKWAWNWTGSGSTTFTERAATDTTACNQA